MVVSGQLHAQAALIPGKYPSTHWIGSLVGPRAGVDAVVKTNYPFPIPVSNRTSVFQPIA
jgi:hypothetical protein